MNNSNSKKIKILDYILKKLCTLDFIKNKVRVIGERCLVAYNGFIFSYITTENGEHEFGSHVAKIYNSSEFIFCDVGAHHGIYTDMILKNFPLYKGYLFEPTPESFSRLQFKFSNNADLEINNIALSNFNGETQLITYPDDPTRNGLKGVGKELNFASEVISCEVKKGDDFFNQIEYINLLKIDAEGHDFNVIKGFENLINKGSIDVIQFEYTFRHSDMRITLRDYYEFFKSKSYKIGPIRQHGVDFYEDFDSRYNEYQHGPNYIAVRLDLVDKFYSF